MQSRPIQKNLDWANNSKNFGRMYPSEFFKNLKLETIIAIRNPITTFSIHPVKLDKTECAWLTNIFAKLSLS